MKLKDLDINFILLIFVPILFQLYWDQHSTMDGDMSTLFIHTWSTLWFFCFLYYRKN